MKEQATSSEYYRNSRSQSKAVSKITENATAALKNIQLNFYLSAVSISKKLLDVLKSELNSQLEKNSLRYQHWLALKIIYFNEANSPAHIAQLMTRHKSFVTKLVNDLEDKKLIVRIQDTVDRRKTILSLTEAGTKVADAGLESFSKIPDMFKESLSAEEAQFFEGFEQSFLLDLKNYLYLMYLS